MGVPANGAIRPKIARFAEPAKGKIMPRSAEKTDEVEAGPLPAGVVAAHSMNGQGAINQSALLHALQAMKIGDFSVRLPSDGVGIDGKIADTFNEIVAANQRMSKQIERVGQVVGREGKTRQRVKFGLTSGAWGEMET